MNNIGAIVLSYEEAGELSDLLPWKGVSDDDLYGPESVFRAAGCTGVVHLSTCNRIAFFYTLERGQAHEPAVEAVLADLPALPDGVAPRLLAGRDAVEHLVRLSAGLESLVLGETEIKAQMKGAFDDAESEARGWIDPYLRSVFQHAFREARTIRSSVPMSNLPLSVAALAARRLKDRTEFQFSRASADGADAPAVVIIGSGPMSRQSAEYLSKWAPRIVLVNRTISKIQSTADRLGVSCLTFDDFLADPEQVGPVTAVVTATSRDDAFIGPGLAQRLKHPDHPLVFVDLALPADVDSGVAELDGVSLINLEVLKAEVEIHRGKRRKAALAAGELIEAALVRIEGGMVRSLSGPIIRDLQKEIRDQSRMRLSELLDDRLSHLSPKDRRLLYDWAVRSNKELNRIHRRGVESVLHNYYAEPPARSSS